MKTFTWPDYGGGTTDVCLGTLKIDEGGRWKFEETKGGALTKSPGPASASNLFQELRYPAAEIAAEDNYALTTRKLAAMSLTRKLATELFQTEVKIPISFPMSGISCIYHLYCFRWSLHMEGD